MNTQRKPLTTKAPASPALTTSSNLAFGGTSDPVKSSFDFQTEGPSFIYNTFKATPTKLEEWDIKDLAGRTFDDRNIAVAKSRQPKPGEAPFAANTATRERSVRPLIQPVDKSTDEDIKVVVPP